MINVNITGIDMLQHKKLIQYILSKCDEISFQLPGVDSDGRVLENPLWQKYHENNKSFLQKCFANGAKQTYSKHYQGMKLGQYGKIIHVKPFHLLDKMLFEYHLYNWLAENGLPEDVCFYSEKQLKFFTCSHEEEFYIYNESKEDVLFLKNNSFEYWIHR